MTLPEAIVILAEYDCRVEFVRTGQVTAIWISGRAPRGERKSATVYVHDLEKAKVGDAMADAFGDTLRLLGAELSKEKQ